LVARQTGGRGSLGMIDPGEYADVSLGENFERCKADRALRGEETAVGHWCKLHLSSSPVATIDPRIFDRRSSPIAVGASAACCAGLRFGIARINCHADAEGPRLGRLKAPALRASTRMPTRRQPAWVRVPRLPATVTWTAPRWLSSGLDATFGRA